VTVGHEDGLYYKNFKVGRMDFREATRIWRRRWILTSILLLVATVCTLSAALKLPRTYQAHAYVTLLTSQQAAQQSGGNPYLNFSTSLNATAQGLVYELTNPHTAQLLESEGSTGSYTVIYDDTAPAPILQATISSSNEAEVARTLQGLISETSTLLQGMQTGTAADRQIRVATLSTTQPKISISITARGIVLVFGIMLILALAVPIVTDSTRRSSQRNTKSEMQARGYESEIRTNDGAWKESSARQVGYRNGQQRPDDNDSMHPAPVRYPPPPSAFR
jgi:hypothetical protein